MPELLDPIYPSDPVEPIDGLYEDIASDSFSREDETGGVHEFDFVVSQFLGNYEDAALGLTIDSGDIIYKVGADGNAIDKVINPTQIQFRVRNDSGLLDKMRGANKRDFKLKIYENNDLIFHGYLLLNTKKLKFYQAQPEVELRAYDGLALLDNLPVSNFPLDYSSEAYITVKEFLSRVEAQMGIQLGWVVHTNFNDASSDEHFPLGYQFKIGQLIRGLDKDDRTWGKALELFARNHFGLQVYQWQGKWHMIGRAERTVSPQAITSVDLDAGTATPTDFTGPLLDQSNAIRFPDGEVIDGLAEVRGNVLLAHGFLQNEAVDFNSVSEVPYWQTNDVSDVQGATAFDQVLRFNTLGSSTVSQLTKTVLEAHFNPAPPYSTRFTVSVEVEILAKDQNSAGDVAVDVDLFKIFTVDPAADLTDDTLFDRLITGGKPDDENEKKYYNVLTDDSDAGYFTVRADQKRQGQAGKLKEAISITQSFDCVLSTHSGLDDVRRYLRVVFKPKAAANQNGGDASLLDKVNLVSMRISRADASSEKKYTSQQQPTSAPNFSQRTDRFTGKNQGDSLSLDTSLSNKDTYNGLYTLLAPQIGQLFPVEALERSGIAFPYATTRARMAMQAVDLDRITLQTRQTVGTSPMQALSFVIDDTTTIRILPTAWNRALTSGFVSITAAEARFDTDRIDQETIYGPPDSGDGDSFESSGSGGGSIAIGGGGSGITDHGNLDGLEDDDHLQYFNHARGDARYVQFNTIPALDQVILNNPPSQDNHALRAGQLLQTTAPITGQDKLRNGVNIRLDYNSVNLKVGANGLDTIQDIHPDADMELKSLLIKEGITLDELASFIQSQVFVGDFVGEGFQLKKDAQGKWQLTVDDIVIRNSAKIYEILVTQLQAFAAFLLTEGHKVEEVEQVGDASWSWNDTINVFADGATNPEGLPYTYADHYKCYIPEDKLLQLALDDLLLRQDFDGRNGGSNEATIIDVEQGDVQPTVNVPRRSFTVYLEDPDAVPLEGWQFARSGNRTDTNRQGGIYFVGTGSDAPYQRMYDGVNRHSKFGSMETIISQNGNLDGLVLPEFAELDGTQNNLYGQVIRNIYASGVINVTGGNAATKDYVDSQTAGTGLQDKLDAILDDAVTNQTTIISGGYIETSFIKIGAGADFDPDYDPSQLRSDIDVILDDALENGTTLIANGFLKNNFINTNGIVVGDLGDGNLYETKSGAQGKVNSLQGDLDGLFDDAIMNGTTIIANGYLKSVIVKATLIEAINLEAISTTTGSLNVNGPIDIVQNGMIRIGNENLVIDQDGIAFKSGNTGNNGGINQLEWREGTDLTGHIYSYRRSSGRNVVIVRAPSNGGAHPSDILLTAHRTQMYSDLEIKETIAFDKQTEYVSGTSEISILAASQKIYLTVTSGQPILSHVGGLPSNGKSMPVTLINESYANDIILRDETNASIASANIRTQTGDDIRLYDRALMQCEWDGENEKLYIQNDRT